MSQGMAFPRDLTEKERSILDFILSHEWEGVEQVRAMLRDTRATGTCTCPCGSIALSVRPPNGKLVSRSPVPAEAVGYVEGVLITVILFVDEESAYLEIVWYDELPPRLPNVDELQTVEYRDGQLINFD